MFGKDFKDEIKLTKVEEVKDADPVIGSSDNQKEKTDKDAKFVEGDDDKKKTPKTDGEVKKKKKKLKKKKKGQTEAGIDNQYEDDVAIEDPGTLNKTRDLDKTVDLDQTKDNLFMAGDTANVGDLASDEAKQIQPKKKGKKKKKKKKPVEGSDDKSAEN